MGSKSAHIPMQDLRAAFELVVEVARWRGPIAERNRHLAEGLQRLTHARVAVVMGMEDYYPGRAPTVVGVTDIGWHSDSERGAFLTYIGGPADEDPLMRRFIEQPGAICTFRRQDLMDDTQWYGSSHYGELRRPARVDHCLYSTLRLPGDGKAISIGLHRPTGDRAFVARERSLLDQILHGLRPVFVFTPGSNPVDQLPPRLRRVALELLGGYGAKHIALRLGLSLHTVYSYSKEVYKAVGVQDRQELQARFKREPGA